MYSSTFSTILPWFFGRVWRRRNEIDLQPSSIAKERTSEAIRLQPLYAFMAQTYAGSTVYSSLHRCTLVQIFSSAICSTNPPNQVSHLPYTGDLFHLKHAPLLHRACGLVALEENHKECGSWKPVLL